MSEWSRRAVLGAMGAMGAGTLLGACGTKPKKEGGGSGDALAWWDHFGPLENMHRELFTQYQKETGVAVEYTLQQAGKAAQAFQLAKQSHQLPDIMSSAGLTLPVPALVQEGWFQPIQLDDETRKRLPDDVLVEGVTTLDGKVYSFPVFSRRMYQPATWFNKELVAKAGLDPSKPPESYDEFRAAARAVQKKGGENVYGWIIALGQPDRLREQLGFLAQVGGFEGVGLDGLEYKTGEFKFHHDAYVEAIEFWLALAKDKVLVPGTTSMVDKEARARWAGGLAGYYLDGPWCAGVVVKDLNQFADKMDVGPILAPEKGTRVTTYRPPVDGTFFVSGDSKRVGDASKLLARLTTQEYYVALAEQMDQPPLDLGVMDKADVHPSYKKVVDFFRDTVFIGPSAVVGNPDVAKVDAKETPVDPHIGQIVQGLFSGDLTDVRGELKKLSDRLERNRAKSLKAARKEGAKVDESAWAFPNWEPGKDYTEEMYDA